MNIQKQPPGAGNAEGLEKSSVDDHSIARVPEAFKLYEQFVVWKLVQRNNDPKPTKLPYNPQTGELASTTNPSTWSTLEQARAAMATGQYAGVGFVITARDPFVFLDFDDCKDEEGEWIDGVAQWGLFDDSTWEYSQSGDGLHVVITVQDKAQYSGYVNKWTRQDGGQNECYRDGRFIAFGPTGWRGEPQPADHMLPLFLPSRTAQSVEPLDWSDCPQPGYDGPSDDAELITRMQNSGSKDPGKLFGDKVRFADLWNADAEQLGQSFPDCSGKRPFDWSRADMALMNHLAWWTGCNHARMWRLFKESKLFRPGAKERTARRALIKAASEHAARGAYIVNRETRMKKAAEIGEGVTHITTPVMALDQMAEKLVFIRNGKGIIHRDHKRPYKLDVAATDYAASKHVIEEDGKQKTLQCLKAWEGVADRLTVDAVTWQPGEQEFCRPLDGHGVAYNTYTPLQLQEAPDKWEEWIMPFTTHVEYLVPQPDERKRFMQWLAHIVQKPGELPHTCWLFVTPTQGTGRGTLAEMLGRVYRGYAAIGASPDLIMSDGFNGRLSKKLLVTIDEIREGARGPHSKEAQTFKGRVTATETLINEKYGLQWVEKNCARWLLFSNHADALPFENGDRRVIVVENPTEARAEDYYAWLRQYLDGGQNERAFVASVQHYLATLDLTGFKAGAHAPLNAAKLKALAAMESEGLRAARQFADTWPAPVATIADIKEFVGEDDWPQHPKQVANLVNTSGMVATGTRLWIGGKREKVIIVNPSVISDSALRLKPNEEIVKIIEYARASNNNDHMGSS